VSVALAVACALAAAFVGWTLGRRAGYDEGVRDGEQQMRVKITRWLSGPM
jgi:ABC-type dipeptide/oligopeptide/nickel transport system permease subunit